MDTKKIIIAIIILFVIIVGAYFVMISTAPKIITYDEHFNVTIPSEFETAESGGLITSAFPKDKTYTLTIIEDNETNVEDMDAEFKIIKDAENLTGFKENFTDIKSYTIGNNKVYEYTTTQPEAIKELSIDAKKVRTIAFVVPNSKKLYTLNFATNDTSLDLHNSDIDSIINSTSTAQ